MPPLDDRYAYLSIEVLSANFDEKTAQVRVLDFDSPEGINVGEVPVGTEGSIDCSALLIFAGIKESSHWIVSYYDQDQTQFPIQIYSLESMESFSDRRVQS